MTNETQPLDHVGSYPDLIEAVPDALLVVNEDGGIAFVNAHTERLFGHPRSQLLGRHFEMLLPVRFKGHGEAIRERFASDPGMRRAGTDLKLFGRHRDGTEFPVEISFAPLGVGPGMGIVASIRDVSDRRRVDAELRDALSLLSATLESTADGILVVAADGTIAGSNERFAVLWGIPAELMDSHEDGRVMAFVLDQLADPDRFVDKVRELYADPGAAETDAAAAAHAGEIARLEAQRGALERQLAVIGKQLEDSREAERAAGKEAGDAARRLATAEVRATTLEQVHNALLARVSPERKGAGE